MRSQNKTVDTLRAQLERGELDKEGFDVRVHYFILGYDLGHMEGYDEGEGDAGEPKEVTE